MQRSSRPVPATPGGLKVVFTLVAAVVLGGPVLAEASEWFFPDWASAPQALEPEHLDAPAPDFLLTDLAGNDVRLSDYRGHTIFLNFWATWCPPCVEELPSMMDLDAAMRGRDFVILAVSEDESLDDVRTFFRGAPPSFPILHDVDGQVTQRFGTSKFPETYVIDPDGRLRAKFVGARDWAGRESIAWFERITR